MKGFFVASVACLTLAAVSVGQAAPFMSSFEADTTISLYREHSAVVGHPYDRCQGRTAGTAHPACGSLTGGPSGGLF